MEKSKEDQCFDDWYAFTMTEAAEFARKLNEVYNIWGKKYGKARTERSCIMVQAWLIHGTLSRQSTEKAMDTLEEISERALALYEGAKDSNETLRMLRGKIIDKYPN